MTGDPQPLGASAPAAFTAFYHQVVGDVYRYFFRSTGGQRNVAEDLTQETFLASVRAFNGGHPDAFTRPWIFGVARHKLIDHYRRQTREQTKLTMVWNEPGNEAVLVPQGFTEADAVELLADLPALHRLILTLRYLDDLPVAEIGPLIGRSFSATQSLLLRARRSLERRLEEVRDE
jgi:RNA polymerase sigma-70 factor (ECF subfamily)